MVFHSMASTLLNKQSWNRRARGALQGLVLSPILANIHFHHALDLWFEDVVKKLPHGNGGDGVVHGRHRDMLSSEADARRVLAVLSKRMGAFDLTLHQEKTQLIHFTYRTVGRKAVKDRVRSISWELRCIGDGHASGFWIFACKTGAKRLRRAIKRINEHCREGGHDSLVDQHGGLCKRLQGHINYCGVYGNIRALLQVIHATKRR